MVFRRRAQTQKTRDWGIFWVLRKNSGAQFESFSLFCYLQGFFTFSTFEFAINFVISISIWDFMNSMKLESSEIPNLNSVQNIKLAFPQNVISSARFTTCRLFSPFYPRKNHSSLFSFSQSLPKSAYALFHWWSAHFLKNMELDVFHQKNVWRMLRNVTFFAAQECTILEYQKRYGKILCLNPYGNKSSPFAISTETKTSKFSRFTSL